MAKRKSQPAMTDHDIQTLLASLARELGARLDAGPDYHPAPSDPLCRAILVLIWRAAEDAPGSYAPALYACADILHGAARAERRRHPSDDSVAQAIAAAMSRLCAAYPAAERIYLLRQREHEARIAAAQAAEGADG